MDFIYWRHPTIPGIKVEEVSGGEHYKGNVWLDMARQLYCENGKEAYRDLGHFRNGAPFLYGESARISLTHCQGLLAVATLPPTPEVDLSTYSNRAALGIDAERADREQVIHIRDRFLSPEELEMIPADDVTANVMAWTIKEAAYKAAFTAGLDFRTQIRITKMPLLAPPTPVFDPTEFHLPATILNDPSPLYGKVEILIDAKAEKADEKTSPELEKEITQDKIIQFKIYTYQSEEHIITLAFAPDCAKFSKKSTNN